MKIEIPSFVVPEWYMTQKGLKKTDLEIAEELHISLPLFAKWKKEIGCVAGEARKYCGRKRQVNLDTMKKLYDRNLSSTTIAEQLGISDSMVRRYIRQLGWKTA